MGDIQQTYPIGHGERANRLNIETGVVGCKYVTDAERPTRSAHGERATGGGVSETAWLSPGAFVCCAMTAEDLHRTLSRAVSARTRGEFAIEGFHRAGVLVPVVYHRDGPRLLFTRRTEAVESHKGQVSFPGGTVEEGDRDIVHTALREAEEEIGIDSGSVEALGLLDDHATPSGFIITPVLGMLRSLPELRPSPLEVAEVFQVPLEYFANPQNVRRERRMFLGREQEVWFYDRAPHVIWGATAAIIRGLLERTQAP
jgi:8-oxo-dGTP pyrophosphatase MutT (NUDIX family)